MNMRAATKSFDPRETPPPLLTVLEMLVQGLDSLSSEHSNKIFSVKSPEFLASHPEGPPACLLLHVQL